MVATSGVDQAYRTAIRNRTTLVDTASTSQS
jgi:hypothetical protein